MPMEKVIEINCLILLYYCIEKIIIIHNLEWLGAMSWSTSVLLSPLVDTVCKQKSTRLLAVIGGLIMSLGILFTSFATEIDQVIFSYGN